MQTVEIEERKKSTDEPGWWAQTHNKSWFRCRRRKTVSSERGEYRIVVYYVSRAHSRCEAKCDKTKLFAFVVCFFLPSFFFREFFLLLDGEGEDGKAHCSDDAACSFFSLVFAEDEKASE
jgi:hypothetical protein